ncbi:MAG: signal peptidase II [Deltaproteobacteria bacterium]|nr:signal peptidase II [Candidatus Tharpella aukensis]
MREKCFSVLYGDTPKFKLSLLTIIVVVVLLLDLWTKALALQHLSPVYPKKIIDGFFSLTLVMNSGVAFGVFSGIESSIKAYLLLALSGVTVGLVIFYYFYEKSMHIAARFGLALVVGGAFGNMIDRWRFHKVVDFLDFYWQNYHWPAFNIADCAISIGVTLLLLDALLCIKRQ